MNKILISGYYGFNNLGDEAILETIIGRIRQSVPDAEIAVLTKTPERTMKQYQIKAYHRAKPLEVLKALMKCNLLISGGGSLLQDVTSKLSILYYLAIILMAKILGKKVMVYSQGIGPIHKEGNRILTKMILNHVDCITVREENSKLDLREIGLQTKAIEVTADPVIDLHPVNPEKGRGILQKSNPSWDASKPTVGFALRSKDFQTTESYENLKACLEAMLTKHQLAFIPFHYNEDLAILKQLESDFGSRLTLMTERLSTEEMLSVIGCFNVLVGVRLHSLIFAAVQNVMPIGVSYDPKIGYFMNTLEMNTLCDVNAMNAQILNEEIERLYANQEKIEKHLANVVESLKHKIDDNDRLLLRLLKRG